MMRIMIVAVGSVKRYVLKLALEDKLHDLCVYPSSGNNNIVTDEGIFYRFIEPNQLLSIPHAEDDYVVIYGDKSDYDSEFISTLERFGDNVRWVK
jgi:hypothetical protein